MRGSRILPPVAQELRHGHLVMERGAVDGEPEQKR